MCYGKNSTQNIFNAASILSRSGLAKTVTLSVQSFDRDVLDSINRKNIKTTTFKDLQKQYFNANISTYTEILLGLPRETYCSFVNGLESAIRLTKNNQIFIYHCQILPNTMLANIDYQQQHGIKSVKTPLTETHVTVRRKDFIQEFDNLIISTNTMSTKEWIRCTVLAWVVQLFHSLKIGYYIIDELVNKYQLNYMDIYSELIDSNINEIQKLWHIARKISSGKSRCQLDEKFGNIYYDPEELAYLQIMCNKNDFYDNLYETLFDFLLCEGFDDNPIMDDIFNEQIKLLPNPNDFKSTQDFATQTILYGRKNNKIALVSV